MFKKTIFLIAVIFFPLANAYARFETLEDASISYDFYNKDTKIKADGTSESIVEIQANILKEDGRELVAKFPLYYNEGMVTIEIIEAKTIFEGVEHKVSEDMIEDKPIANNRPGFDDTKLVSISFPHPEIGAQIYLKYKEHHYKPRLENEFAGSYYFGTADYWKKSNIKIDSEIDLRIKINDPGNNLSVKTESLKDNPDYFRKAEITLLNPITTRTINETYDSSLNSELFTYISLSSLDSWNKLGNIEAVGYLRINIQELPEVFLTILNLAKKEKDIESQLNVIIQNLNEKIQYFGTWQSYRGKFIPQDLQSVADKQSGDCKDFAYITARLLTELGYRANVALVERGEFMQEEKNILVNPDVFNHVIVRVLDENGKTYWIDPTNLVSMPDGIFPDIAGRHALVLDEKDSNYEYIPNVSESHATISINKTVKQDEIVDVVVDFKGESAMQWTGMGLYLAPKGVEDRIYSLFIKNGVEESDRISHKIPPLNTRIVEPITISLEYKKPDLFFKTNLGKGYLLDAKWSFLTKIAKIDTSSDVNDVYLGHPSTVERTTTIKQKEISNLKKLDFDLSTPYISLLRKCYTSGEDSIVEEKVVIHQSWIPNREFNSEDFKKLQKLIKDEIIDSALVINSE